MTIRTRLRKIPQVHGLGRGLELRHMAGRAILACERNRLMFRGILAGQPRKRRNCKQRKECDDGTMRSAIQGRRPRLLTLMASTHHFCN